MATQARLKGPALSEEVFHPVMELLSCTRYDSKRRPADEPLASVFGVTKLPRANELKRNSEPVLSEPRVRSPTGIIRPVESGQSISCSRTRCLVEWFDNLSA